MTGRPPCYTAELAERVLDALSTGRTLGEVCSDDAMPCETTVRKWVQEDVDGFAARYRRARQIGHGRIGQIPYTAEIEDLILGELKSGRTLTDVCRDPDMPHVRSVQNWLAEDRNGFAARYKKAREIGCDMMADDMVDIADDRTGDWIVRHNKDGTTEAILDPERINRTQLRIKTRRWRVSKVLPQTYGDRLDLNAKQERGDSWADLLKAVDGKSRGLPNKVRESE